MRRIGAVLAVLAAGAALLVGTPDQPAVAAPPDTIDQALLLHDGHSDVYRVPFGTVAPDQRVTLRFRTAANDVDEVFLRMQDAVGKERRLPMTIAAADTACETGGEARCDFWQATYTPPSLGTYSYRFLVRDGSAVSYYADTAFEYGGVGAAAAQPAVTGYRIHVIDPKQRVVPWLRDGVMYQIFPDRFANGDSGNDPSPNGPRYDYPAPPNATPEQLRNAELSRIQNRTWTQMPEGYCRTYDQPATPCAEDTRGRDYFGGDLKGVTAKLDYLKKLGVSILYLNPIFTASSNHAYDVRDFYHVDPAFGGDAAFRELLKGAHQRGMRVILDGPFAPASSDSPYFDRYGHFPEVGACESASSPIRDWFILNDAGASGPCVGEKSARATYESWGGSFDALPLFRKKDPNDPSKPYGPVADYFYRAKGSVARHWLDLGVDGWRLDSMQEPSFPLSYWQEFRKVVKKDHPDAPLIGEAWHWYDNFPLTNGDTADSPMGYRFRAAVLGLLGGVGSSKGFPGDDDPNLPVSTFVDGIESIQQDYSPETVATFMNLVSSHDVPRSLWLLTPGRNNAEEKEQNAANLAVGKAKATIAAAVQFTLPGTPSVYYGDEVGLTGFDDPDNRRTFPWQADGSAGGDAAMRSAYQTLAKVRRDNPVLSRGELRFLSADNESRTVSYAMRDSRSVALTVVNRDEKATRTVEAPTGGYLRDGVAFRSAFGPAAGATTVGGKLTLTLPPLTAQVLVSRPGQDLQGPSAPRSVEIRASADEVRVSWSADAPRYQVLRSELAGGGYQPVATVEGERFADRAVEAGRTYHYIVKALDAAGNLGALSKEVTVRPAVRLTKAELIAPTSLRREISSSYDTVTARVRGLGAVTALSVRGEVGVGGTWSPMSLDQGTFTGRVRAETVGRHAIRVRFSADGGRSWTYAEPGRLEITPSADTSPPSAPVTAIDWAETALTVSWPSVPSAAEYRVYRARPGGPFALLATVNGTTHADYTVAEGDTYRYVVRAVDEHLNVSAASNEVAHKVERKVVHTTFRVRVPDETPDSQTVYLAGATTGLRPGETDPLCLWCGGNATTAMTRVAPGVWELTRDFPVGASIQYKYTRGNWNTVERWGSIVGFVNRTGTITPSDPSAPELTQVIDNTGSTGPDNGRAVGNWGDPLVRSLTAASDSVAVGFNWPVAGAGTDPNDMSAVVTVTRDGAAVAGSAIRSGDSVTWRPSSPLAAGTYHVMVDHVLSLPDGSTGVTMAEPFVRDVVVSG